MSRETLSDVPPVYLDLPGREFVAGAFAAAIFRVLDSDLLARVAGVTGGDPVQEVRQFFTDPGGALREAYEAAAAKTPKEGNTLDPVDKSNQAVLRSARALGQTGVREAFLEAQRRQTAGTERSALENVIHMILTKEEDLTGVWSFYLRCLGEDQDKVC